MPVCYINSGGDFSFSHSRPTCQSTKRSVPPSESLVLSPPIPNTLKMAPSRYNISLQSDVLQSRNFLEWSWWNSDLSHLTFNFHPDLSLLGRRHRLSLPKTF